MNITKETETYIVLRLTIEEAIALKESTSNIIHIDHNSKNYGIVDEIDENLRDALFESTKEES